jgi:hypothetical protein
MATRATRAGSFAVYRPPHFFAFSGFIAPTWRFALQKQAHHLPALKTETRPTIHSAAPLCGHAFLSASACRVFFFPFFLSLSQISIPCDKRSIVPMVARTHLGHGTKSAELPEQTKPQKAAGRWRNSWLRQKKTSPFQLTTHTHTHTHTHGSVPKRSIRKEERENRKRKGKAKTRPRT